jgi:hypothetical protein
MEGFTEGGALVSYPNALGYASWPLVPAHEGKVVTNALSGCNGPNRLGYLRSDGRFFVKEGAITAPWTEASVATKAIAISGNRLGYLRSDGRFFVKEGAITAPWTEASVATQEICLHDSCAREEVVSQPSTPPVTTPRPPTSTPGPSSSVAGTLLDRNVGNPTLKVDALGRAGISYVTQSGQVRRVLVWGAVDALPPQSGREQVRFQKDYAGGWGAFRKDVVASMVNTCTPIRPPLPWLVTACRARDGSFWALQIWQRALPNLGHQPWTAEQSARELHVSHWTGDLARLEVYLDWSYAGRFHHLFGRLTYRGKPVHGFRTTSTGVPLDSWGRNLYVDTFNSAYGPGWRRENSFVAHKGTGVFCYGFYDHAPHPGYPPGRRPPGHGERYRITVLGPGVTPIVSWEGRGLPDYDGDDPLMRDRELRVNALQRSWNDRLCQQN